MGCLAAPTDAWLPALTMAAMTAATAIPAAQLRLSVAPMMDWMKNIKKQIVRMGWCDYGAVVPEFGL